MPRKIQRPAKNAATATQSLILAYSSGPKGPYAGGVTLLFLAGILIAYPEAFFKIKLLFDEPADNERLEKRKSVMKKIGYGIAVLALLQLIWTTYNQLYGTPGATGAG